MHVWSARPKQPYPGLRPFQPDEWSIFFGRETIVDDIIERLAIQRVVLIHGASGSGKSSLVLAGVMPRLARQHLRHGVSWVTCAMRPSGGPLWNLAREFARIEGREDDVDRIGQIIRLFNRRDATLANVVNSLHGLEGKRLCILVDQFEELFRFERETSREEAELFVELLIGEIAAVDSDDSSAPIAVAESGKADIHIAITMRSEFLGECARFDGFAEAVNRTQYLVPRMRYEALLRAIQRPAEIYGGRVTSELAKRLVADVRGREDELPLIQHGLMLLWNAAAKASDQPVILDVEQFEHAGGLTKLLSDHANRVMASVSPPASSSTLAIERLFRALTDINAEGRAIRRPQSFRELVAICDVAPQDLHRIIDAFRADGVSFLTPYFPTKIEDKTVIDISHEALIRCWNLIADPQIGWLRREFQDGLIWRALLNDAKGFESNRKHILSPAATTQRLNWFADRNPSWSERYGGNWDSVTKLLQASRRMAMRSVRGRRLVLTFAAYGALLGAGLILGEVLRFAKNSIAAASIILIIPVMCLMYFFIIQLAVDYLRQYVPSRKVRRWAVWCIFLVAVCASVIGWYFGAPEWISVTLIISLSFATFIVGVWLTMAIATFLMRYIALPPRVVQFLEIEPTIVVRRQSHRACAVS